MSDLTPTKYKSYISHGDQALKKRTLQKYGITNTPDAGDEAVLSQVDTIVLFFKVIQDTERDTWFEPMEFQYVHEEQPSNHEYDHPVIDIPFGVEDSKKEWAENIAEDFVKSKETFHECHYKSLQDFIESKEFSEKVTMECDKTIGEIFLMLLKFIVMNSLSLTATVNLFKLINVIFQRAILPDSNHIINNILNPKGGIEYHAVCSNCNAYVGELLQARLIRSCTVCNNNLDLNNPSNPSFFVLINPSNQIADCIKTHEKHYQFVTNERVHEKDYLKDVYDGKMYRQFVKSLPESEKSSYVSACFNTDGAPKFKSSKSSIWPLFLQINELPAQDRLNNLVTCGLWFNKKQPDMTVFIREFVRYINNVRAVGIPCILNGIEKNLKLYVINCCADAVARAPIQGIKKFNAYFGCNFCLNQGIHAEGSMKFTNVVPLPNKRTHEDTLHIMLNMNTVENKYGVKYPSPLINFPYFDIIKGFLPDYMHSCLEGVAKQFLNYFLGFLSDDTIQKLDENMKKISVPQQVARLTRPLSERGDWKAREYENFVLYYSVPLLTPIIEKKKLKHWLMFVESLHILLQDKSHISELDRADVLLHKFVFETETLYGIKAMTYNLHLMLHLTESVVNWGPLWTNSTFPFESQNYYVLKAIKSSNGVTQQAVRYFNTVHSMYVVENYVGRTANIQVLQYCQDVLTARIKNIFRTNGTVYFGQGLKNTEMSNYFNLSPSSTVFHKIVKDKCLYESSSIKKTRSNNSYVLLSDARFAHIHGFVVDGDEELTVCSIIRTRHFSNDCKKVYIINCIENERILISTNSIYKVCVIVEAFEKSYICPVPNLLHY